MHALSSRGVTGLVVLVACVLMETQMGADLPTAAGTALARLKSGNAGFVAHPEQALPIDAARRSALVEGQAPMAAILSCADSRVPPEVIFRAGLGELFVVRAAGHVSDRSVLASLEYAAGLQIPLIVVMGHESCGAVKAAVDDSRSPARGENLDFMLGAIRPAAAATVGTPSDRRLRAAILRHVEDTINTLLDRSATLRHLAEAERLTFVGAYYELSTGRAHFSEPAVVPLSAAKGPVAAQPAGHQ